MALWHLTLAARRRGPLFPTEQQQRAAVRCLARVAGDQLALFSLVTDHSHIGALEDSKKLGKLKRRLRLSLSTISSEPIEAVWHERVEDPKHARKLVRYFINQVVHHDEGVHPALHSGSCLHEILGTRVVPGLALQTAAVGHPRPHEVLAHAGLEVRQLVPVTDPDLRSLGACRLRAAATAAIAAGPTLAGKTAPEVIARHVTAQMGHAAGIPVSELAHALRVHPDSVHNMLRRPVPVDIVAAVRLRLGLEQALAAVTGCTFRLWR